MVVCVRERGCAARTQLCVMSDVCWHSWRVAHMHNAVSWEWIRNVCLERKFSVNEKCY